MNYVVEKMKGFSVIGFSKDFSYENSYVKIPEFWDEICNDKMLFMKNGDLPKDEVEKIIMKNHIGEFGVCIDEGINNNTFRYMIAGRYTGGEVPQGLVVYDFEDMEWAKFKCFGPNPESLQKVNTQIWKEWLPENKEYEIAGKYNIEWYSPIGCPTDSDYQSEIWIPVKHK